MMNKKDLINFEKEVIKQWEKGETYGPIHLSGGNEQQLIDIFKNIKSYDWVFTTHRSHYHALLKSQDPEWLMNEIIVNANSSHINSEKYKIFSSAIVGGNIPIALGVAMGIKINWNLGYRYIDISTMDSKKGIFGTCMGMPHVWCFVGDMASWMGCYNEALKYATGHDLPITFIVENNNIGCETPTKDVWGMNKLRTDCQKEITYNYKRVYPHCGTGKMLKFKKKFKSTGNYDAYK